MSYSAEPNVPFPPEDARANRLGLYGAVLVFLRENRTPEQAEAIVKRLPHLLEAAPLVAGRWDMSKAGSPTLVVHSA
jgi:hypothetical protein